MRRYAATAVLYLSTLSIGAPINRLDIFDAADNRLLFVTFEYNGTGVCTGRSVFAGDSTFMYKTSIQADGSGGTTKENSVDYLENPIYTATIKNSGTSAEFSTVDQFGLSQFGSALSHTQSETNLFSINQGAQVVCKEKYEYDSTGSLSKIIILGKDNETLWYAIPGNQNVGITKTGMVKAYNSLGVNASRGVIKFRCVMAAERLVTAELITPSGRRVAYLVNKKLPPGSYSFTTQHAGLTASGTYIVKVSMNGTAVLTQKVIVQK
ncbi:MAG TPA: hypothetical protein VHO70_23385, partial [Chitinispirillaceae bacterium]|nr:hypothetical protein [Chitinispirillaceae bacterium]